MEFFSFNINIKLRLICGFITRLFNMSVVPFMAIYFAQITTPFISGIVLTLSIILNIISNLFGGYLADVFNKKNVLVIGILLNSFSLIFIGLSMFSSFIYLTILFFLLNSICSVIYKASLSAMIIEATSDDNRRKVFGYNYWLVNLSVALGISIGGLFFKEYSNYIYLIAGTATLIVSIIYYKYMKNYEKQTTESNESPSIKKIFYNYSYAIKDKSFLFFILAGGIIFSSEWHLTNIISVNLNKNNIINSIGNYSFDAINTIALLQVINTIIILFLSIYISKYMERYKVKYILLIGTSLYSLSYIFMLTTNSIYFMILLIVIASLGELIFAPSYQVAQVDIMDLDKKGSYSALGSLATQSSSLIASLTLMISQYLNIYLIFIILTLLSITAILTLYKIYDKRMESV